MTKLSSSCQSAIIRLSFVCTSLVLVLQGSLCMGTDGPVVLPWKLTMPSGYSPSDTQGPVWLVPV